MSAGILLGIGIVGGGWLLLASKTGREQNLTALSDADSKTVPDVGEPSGTAAGATAVVGNVDCGTQGSAILGGSAPAGTNPSAAGETSTPNNVQAPIVAFAGPTGESGVKVDYTKSAGGTDPSTAAATTLVASVQSPPFAATRIHDPAELIYRATWGEGGAEGTTRVQRGNAYRETGGIMKEVW